MARISPARVQSILLRGDTATTTINKGRALEDLICYVFEKVPGIEVTKRNQLNTFHSEELDVAFWNRRSPSGLYFTSNIVLVECKNWSQPLGSIEVNWFDSKLRARSQDFGILVAANGITGSAQDKTAAHQTITQSLQDGRKLVVLTRSEIEQFRNSTQVVELIQAKLCELAVCGTLFL